MPLDSAPVGPVVAVSDLEASRRFYEETLGLRGEQTPGGHLVRAGGDTVIYLLDVGDQAGTAAWPVASFKVDDIRATVSDLRDGGVEFLADVPFDLDDLGIADQGDLAVAWMRDPDGNVITVFSSSA